MTKLTLVLLLPLFLALAQVTATSRSPTPSPSPALAPSPSPSEQPGEYTLIDKKDYGNAHVLELAQSVIFSYYYWTPVEKHHFSLRLRSVLKAEYLNVKQGETAYRLKMQIWRRDPNNKKVVYDCVYGALLYWNRNLPKHSKPLSAATISFHRITCEKIHTFGF